MTGIVILNYNGSENTADCIRSIYESEEKEILIIIVDNGSEKEEIRKLTEICSRNEIVILTGENLGYAAGNNIGIREAIERGCEYICILNNDVIVRKKFLTPCIEYLRDHGDTIMAGPIIIDYTTRKIQSNGARINIWTGDTPGINCGKDEAAAADVSYCDYIGGACIVLRAEDVSKIGFIPEKYFLLYEETEWCYRATRQGWKIVSLCNSKVEHKGGMSIKKLGGLNGYLYERNRVVFVKENCSGKIQYVFFLGYNTLRILLRTLRRGKDYLKQLSYMRDGMKGRVDPQYSYIRINPEYSKDQMVYASDCGGKATEA